MAPDWASLGEPAELADVPPEVRQLVHEAPDKETVQAVVEDILSRVGDQMGELRNAIDDLLWDHHEPYHELSADEQKAWREAFEAELNGGYEPTTTASPKGEKP
ncbi:hypothetical protein GCM10017673_40490 [Streptosporangium violaceochromogenes]|nr:hypothetical protein GCM10017673_40490 [Streptosporangium violaceochromogenes]